MEYTFTHIRQTVQIYQEDDRGQSPKSILPHPKGPQHQTHITTSWQNAQMILCAHKMSSTSNTSQNTSCPKEKLAGRTPADLLGLGASKRIFAFFQGKTSAGSQCRAGEKQGGPSK